MPTYEYACKSCGHDLEVFQRMSEEPLEVCPSCNEPALKRKIGLGAGIIFKGGGFYETDFKSRKGTPPSDSSSTSESKDSAPKPEKKEAPAPKAEN
ncbi:MAG TPA: zinc ribbon domain-containing protein [Oceanipulchritudo sp.]|nr:zinc ribbon domain-containing protein [Oceanipulchritudo sp.]